MTSLDLSVFYAIHSLAGRSALLDTVIVFFGTYLIYMVVIGLVSAAAYAWWQRRNEQCLGYLAAIAAAFIARYVVASGIRLVYERPRPFVALDIPHLLSDSAYSFPSGHTIFTFALAAALYRHNKVLAWCLAAIGLLIGLARVAGGVHYPSDIAGGVILGAITGILVSAIWIRVSPLLQR